MQLYKVKGARKASLPGAEKRKKLAEPPSPMGALVGSPMAVAAGPQGPGGPQNEIRVPALSKAQDHVHLSSCTTVCKTSGKYLHMGITESAPLGVSLPKKHSGRAGRVGQFCPSKYQGIARCLWPCYAGLHTGVSSATFFRSPAAREECWVPSEPSASRIFRRTFWLVLLHSEYSWQW